MSRISAEWKLAVWSTLALLMVFVGLWVGTAHAQVSYVYAPSGVSADTVTLRLLPDGGCSVSACGRAVSTDGGSVLPLCVSDVTIRRAVFQTRCANFIDAARNLLSASLGAGSDGGTP